MRLSPPSRRALFAGGIAAAFVQPTRAADLDVAVVGAGVAGFAAAHTVLAARRSVVILEARERTGGRVYTDGSVGIPFDHGAPTRPRPAGVSLMVDGKEIDSEDYVRFARLAEEIGRMVQALRKEAPGIDPRAVIRTTDALEKLALAEVLRRMPFPPFSRLPVTDGRLPVRLGARVIRIDSTGRLVKLVTPGGEVLARAVVVTVPVGVLASGLGFAPPLRGNRVAAIASLPMTQADKVCVTFSRRVFDAPDDTRVLAWTAKQTAVEALLRPDGREAAIVTYRGEDARQLEAGGAQAAASNTVSALAELFGKDVRSAFLRAASTRWGLDPYARGAWAEGPAEARAALAAPHHDRIFFAGEATDRESGVGGANASGHRAAREALAALK